MALWDAIARVLIGALLITLAVELKGVFTVGLVVGVILILTAMIGFCPLYKLIGYGSQPKTET
ncbi:MAG: DUF2892 domain-containing protein [Persephonella sp.]|nr:MAG: DUF2892 domain-containing protein [Persephonella sp.]RUM59876.1 MAG: DUF2892 domain-containing protein [Persephonella sp.]